MHNKLQDPRVTIIFAPISNTNLLTAAHDLLKTKIWQLFLTLFVFIVYKSNLETQNHVLQIIYSLHHKLQGTPMTEKKNIKIFV